jgi:hypothetical protein
VTGAGGVRGYWTSGQHFNPVSGKTETATGCKPVPYAGRGTPESATPSRFMHNSWRDWTPPTPPAVTHPRKKRAKHRHHRKRRRAHKSAEAPMTRNDVLLATEENTVTDCATSGRFVTYDLRGTYAGEGFKDTAKTHHRMRVLDTWTPKDQPGSTGCDSSHYFTSRGDGITANAFYTQGVRFLDTSNPADIRQVGYFVNVDSNTWAAYWHKGYVFVADLQRGIDVLQFDGKPGAAPTVRAPALRGRNNAGIRFDRHVFGGLCPVHALRG